jgi:chitodextrinase
MNSRRQSHRGCRPAVSRRLPVSSGAFARLRGLLVFAVALGVVVVGPGSFGMGPLAARHSQHSVHVVPMTAQPSHAPLAPALQARASRLTDEIRALTGALKAPHANEPRLARRLVALSHARQRVLVRLLAKDPAATRPMILPSRGRVVLGRLHGASVEKRVNLQGTYRVWHHDDFKHPSRDTYLDQLVTRTGKVFTLHGAGSDASVRLTFARLKPSVRLSVRGYLIGDQVLATQVKTSAARSLASASATTTVGAINTAVIVANFADSTTSIDMNALRTLFQGRPGADVVSYFNEASYGKASIVPSFYGPYRLAGNGQSGCGDFDTSELMQLANTDVDYTKFKRVIFIGNCDGYGATASNELPMPTPDGTVSLATIVEDASYSTQLYTQIHELSHTLGGYNFHASWFDCSPNAFMPPTAFDTGCDTAEYGDAFDVLGGGPSHFTGELDPYHKWNAGWLSSSQFPTVTATGTYTLAPYESPANGIAALNIPRGTSGSNFTVEYRRPIGFDSWMGSVAGGAVTHGASIRLTGYSVNGSGGGSDTELIDTTPGTISDGGYYPTSDALDGALLPGKTFTDPEYGVVITTVSADAAGLTVNVTVPAQTCRRGAPTVTAPSPSSQSGSGLSISSTFTMTNTDSSGCLANRFRFTPLGGSVGTTQYVATPDMFTLAPGASTTVSVSVTLPKTSTTGTYTLAPGEIDSNTYGNYTTLVPALTYQLTAAADTTPPSAPASPAATALGSAAVSLSWAPSTDNVGVIGYRILRNGSNIVTTTATSFIDTGLAAGATYSYSVQAFDVRGNLSTASTVAATTPAKKDFTRPTPPIVSATAGDHTITLSWSPSFELDGTVAAYRLSPCLLAQCTLPATTTSVRITGLPTQTRYDLTIYVVNADGNWAGSDATTVYTAPAGATAPAQPQRLYSSSGSFSGANLSWTAASGATAYQIFRNNRPLATVSGTSFTDPTPGNHEYFVEAVGDSGALSPPTARAWALGPDIASSDATPPTSSVSAPSRGATVSGVVTVSAQGSDNVGVYRVGFYVDGVYQSEDNSSPFTYSWDTTRLSNGVHWVNVVAYDQSGNYGSDGGYSVSTANGAGGGGGTTDTVPPSVSIAAPTNGSTVTATANVDSSASDNVGVAKVELLVDGTIKATDTTAPYTFTWDTGTAVNGSHSVAAKAFDAAGNSASAAVSVTVSNPTPDTTPPSAPSGLAATAAGSTAVNLSWTASTDDVGVSSYDVYRDGTKIGSVTSTSYGDTGLAPATPYTYTVVARDAAGNVSPTSNSAQTTTAALDTTAPSKPGNPRAAVTGTTQIALYWSASTDTVGVVAYEVWRDGSKIAESPIPRYLDSGLLPASSHAYQVFARDAAGNRSVVSSTLSTHTSSVSTSSTGTIAGVVYNAQGKALGNVIVQITVNGTLKSAKTSSSGVFKLASLPPGDYTPTLTLAGYQTTTLSATAVHGQTVLAATVLTP